MRRAPRVTRGPFASGDGPEPRAPDADVAPRAAAVSRPGEPEPEARGTARIVQERTLPSESRRMLMPPPPPPAARSQAASSATRRPRSGETSRAVPRASPAPRPRTPRPGAAAVSRPHEGLAAAGPGEAATEGRAREADGKQRG